MDNRDLLSSVFDSLPVGVVLLDELGNVVLYNRAEEEMAGRKRQQVIGRNFFEDVAPCTNVVGLGTDYRAQVVDGTLQKLVNFRFPRPFVEEPRDVRLRLDALRIQGRPYGLLVVEDVSAARAVERTKDYLVRMLAHDMNSPLTIVTLAFDLLGDEAKGGSDDELWASARYAARRLRDMVVNLFDITRLQTSDVPSRVSAQDVVPTLSASVAMAHGLADPKGVELDLVVAPSLTLDCDSDLLRRALDNLLDNAIRYSPPKRHVTLRALIDGDSALFHVEDEGPGIPQDVQQLLFKAFVRGDTKEDATLEHHGLGLAFVDLVAREHGGSVSVHCPPSGGSVFTLRLPIETPHLESDAPAAQR
ncbi:MAG: ATP-binding protein [Polyangiales bacterium]